MKRHLSRKTYSEALNIENKYDKQLHINIKLMIIGNIKQMRL